MNDGVTTLSDYFRMDLPWLLIPLLITGVLAGLTRYFLSSEFRKEAPVSHVVFVAMIGGIVFAQIFVLMAGEYLPATFSRPDPITGALLIFICGFFSVDLFLFSIKRFQDRLGSLNGKKKRNGTKN